MSAEMKKLYVGLPLVVVLSIVVVPLSVAARRPKDQQLCVFATSELNGVLIPCGCAPDQLGGLARRATMLQRYKSCRQRLVVDNGNLTAGFGLQETLKAETAVQALAAMGCFAVNLGERDFFLGIDVLKRVRKLAPAVHLLCANVKHGSAEWPIEPFAVWRGKGSAPSVLLIGVLSPMFQEQFRAVDATRGLSIEPAAAAVRRVLDDPAAKADVVVLMVRGPVTEARTLAKAFPQVSLLVAGQGRAEASTERPAGGRQLILLPGRDGEYVESAAVSRSADGTSWAVSPRDITPLSKQFADAPVVMNLLRKYQQRLFEEGLLDKIERVELKGGRQFAGSLSCQPCHAAEYKTWSSMKHAAAYRTLVNEGQQYDPDCVACHVTGFGYKSGFYSAKGTPDMAGVGCESCHGAGSLHRREPLRKERQRTPYGKVAPADCLTCHTPARSPKFDYDAYLPKIKHWEKGEGDP